MIAQRLGFEAAAKRIDVTVGATSNLTLSLVALALNEEPRTFYKITDGLIVGPDVYCFCVIVFKTYVFELNLTTGASEVVNSMKWDANTPTTARYLGMGVVNGETRNFTFGRSPLTTNIPELEVKKAKDKATVSYHIYFKCQGATFTPQCIVENSPDILVPVVAYQQRVTHYSTVFYNQVSPAGYTGLPA